MVDEEYDKLILELIQELRITPYSDPKYDRLVKNLATLFALRKEENKKHESLLEKPWIVNGIVSLLGLTMLLVFEQSHVITSSNAFKHLKRV